MECNNCQEGINMCKHLPCNGTPQEFEKIMDKGVEFAKKLRLMSYLGIKITKEDPFYEFAKLLQPDNDFTYDVPMLAGGKKGYDCTEDEENTSFKGDHCKFLTEDEKCELHTLGLKPEEGRESCCKVTTGWKKKIYYAKLWDTDEGKRIIEKWKLLVNYK